MNERKEKAGDYEITHEIRFGGRTLILGVHPDKSAKLPYMTCFKEIDLLYNTVFTDAFASDDYTEVMDIFSERLRNAVRRMKGIRKKRNVPFSAPGRIERESGRKADYSRAVQSRAGVPGVRLPTRLRCRRLRLRTRRERTEGFLPGTLFRGDFRVDRRGRSRRGQSRETSQMGETETAGI